MVSEVKLVRKYRAYTSARLGEWTESFFDADTELRAELSKQPGGWGDIETRLFAEREPDATPKTMPKTMTFSEAVAKLKDGTVFITRLHPDWVGEKRRVRQGVDGRLLISRETDYMLTYNWVPMLESLTAEDWVVAE